MRSKLLLDQWRFMQLGGRSKGRSLFSPPQHKTMSKDELIAGLLEVLDYIATEGSDCPPYEEPATFYRNQLLACIGHAARAIAEADQDQRTIDFAQPKDKTMIEDEDEFTA